VHERREDQRNQRNRLRGQRSLPLRQRPARRQERQEESYPDHIRLNFNVGSDLWWHVLAYWFPKSQGFQIEHEWDFEGRIQRPATLAVLLGQDPIAVVDLRPEISREALRGHPEQAKAIVRRDMNRLFDEVSIWSAQPALCVISALGHQWNAIIRPTDMTSEMAKVSLGYDWYGEWDDDVRSEKSYRSLGSYLKVLKSARKCVSPGCHGGNADLVPVART